MVNCQLLMVNESRNKPLTIGGDGEFGLMRTYEFESEGSNCAFRDRATGSGEFDDLLTKLTWVGRSFLRRLLE